MEIGNEFTFRGIWHQHNVFGYDITGCRASPGPSLHEEYPEMKDVYPSIHKDMVEENEIILLN